MLTVELRELHSKMVRDVFLVCEQRLNRDMESVAEYFVQQCMVDFFSTEFKNTDLRAVTETSGRIDVVIKQGEEDVVFYELKTYFRNQRKISISKKRSWRRGQTLVPSSFLPVWLKSWMAQLNLLTNGSAKIGNIFVGMRRGKFG